MTERPDLEKIREERFGPNGYRYADRSPVLLSVLDYALVTEARLAAALVVVEAAVLWRGDPIYQHERALDRAIDTYVAAVDACEAGAE